VSDRAEPVDGHALVIPRIHYAPGELAAALEAAGFVRVEVRTTGRFFLLARGTAA
jgi:hypothetical protein